MADDAFEAQKQADLEILRGFQREGKAARKKAAGQQLLGAQEFKPERRRQPAVFNTEGFLNTQEAAPQELPTEVPIQPTPEQLERARQRRIKAKREKQLGNQLGGYLKKNGINVK